MDQPGLPAWNEHGLLPPGVHTCALAEIEARLGAFQRSDRRIELCRRLKDYFRELQKTSWDFYLLIDGSFVMHHVDEPNDIDMLLVLPADWDLFADVLPMEYNLLSKVRVRRNFGFDLFTVRAGSPQERAWPDFFARISPRWETEFGLPNGLAKGLLRVVRE